MKHNNTGVDFMVVLYGSSFQKSFILDSFLDIIHNSDSLGHNTKSNFLCVPCCGRSSSIVYASSEYLIVSVLLLPWINLQGGAPP